MPIWVSCSTALQTVNKIIIISFLKGVYSFLAVILFFVAVAQGWGDCLPVPQCPRWDSKPRPWSQHLNQIGYPASNTPKQEVISLLFIKFPNTNLPIQIQIHLFHRHSHDRLVISILTNPRLPFLLHSGCRATKAVACWIMHTNCRRLCASMTTTKWLP